MKIQKGDVVISIWGQPLRVVRILDNGLLECMSRRIDGSQVSVMPKESVKTVQPLYANRFGAEIRDQYD